ncbi:hypothetical protein NPX13_g3150 [Xylaria arbuscula]|uniref:HOOK N-terminal domain-containing protein n=1 Tax=Xylaria arbuscula TaxID=114810 RepID=A0A9W8TN33_9PEZI|nr:hypothetical protein NPX13_g3150 [Xylaria arbuscula]
MDRQATHVALLEWANAMIATFAPDRQSTLKAKKAEQLFDGVFFSALLEILDPNYNPARFEQSLEASKTGNEARRSMHIIHISLNDFARRLCPKIEPLIRMTDFQALDRDPTRAGISEVSTPLRPPFSASRLPPRTPRSPRSPYSPSSNHLKHPTKAKTHLQVLLILLCGACFHKDNSQYISLIQGLDSKYQTSVFQIITEVDKKLEDNVTTDNDSSIITDSARLDADLAHEAAIADLQREAEDAKRQAGSLKVRLDRLQDNYDELVRKHEELQDDNEQLQKQIESEAGNFDRHRLQRSLKENETLIANLENERNALVEERDRLLKDKSRLENASQKAESLIDENQELKAKNEELSKKANMADNLRKKVEAFKHVEAEVAALRNEKMEITQTYDQLTYANSKIETLKRESEAYASKMQGYEIDIANMRDQKVALVTQNQDMLIRLSELEQRSQLDEAVVKDLQEKVLMLDPSATVDDSLTGRPTSLEDELNDSNNMISMRNLEVQRLQAENAVLKSSVGSETDKGQLLQEMEGLRNSRQAIQDKYNDLFERFTVGQKQIDSLIQNLSGQGLVETIQACYDMDPEYKWLMSGFIREEAYSNLRTQVLAEQSRSKQFERQLEILKEQLADKERTLLEARGDCKAIFIDYVLNREDADDEEKVTAVEKSSVDALTELKNTDGMIAASLRTELEVERKKSRLLKDESDAMQKQLLAALIEKDELRREAENANLELQKAADGHTPSTESIKQSEKMEKLRTRYKQLQQVSGSSTDLSDTLSDEDETDVVAVEETRQTMWQSFNPWFKNPSTRPEDGFHPYEVDDDGSLTIPKYPVSNVSRCGSSSADHDSAWNSGCNTPSLKSQYEQSEVKNRELERTLKGVRAGAEANTQKAQTDEMVKNLQRENTLIATAWYDLSSRLQSNHFVLQRRNENPKSWLNKQRVLINATPRR